MLKERQRQIHADNEAGDSDLEEPWARRPYLGSRRAAERARRRVLEAEEDEADREREVEELDGAAQAAEEAASAEAAAVAQAEAAATAAAAEAEAAAAAAAQFGADDAIYQAMMAAATAQPKPAVSVALQEEALPGGGGSGKPAGQAPLKRKAVSAAFGEDEDEEAPKRKLIPIRYSEEELRAMQQQEAEQAAAPAAASGAQQPPNAAAAGAAARADPAALRRQLMSQVPKETAAVFSFPLQWALLDSASEEVQQRISGWVGKKVVEYLGLEEPSFKAHVLDLVKRHTPAGQMQEELHQVLDDAATEFTTRLFQVLIFESLKIEAGV